MKESMFRRGRIGADSVDDIHEEAFQVVDTLDTHPTKGWPHDKKQTSTKKSSSKTSNSKSKSKATGKPDVDVIEIEVISIEEIPSGRSCARPAKK